MRQMFHSFSSSNVMICFLFYIKVNRIFQIVFTDF